MFLLVPAYPGCPGSKAVKRSLLLSLRARSAFQTITARPREARAPIFLRSWSGAITAIPCLHLYYAAAPRGTSRDSAIRPTDCASLGYRPFNGPFSGTTGPTKVKPIWIILKQETVSGSGISWAICKSAPRSRHITTPEPHHSFFTGRMPFLPPNQQRQSTEGKCDKCDQRGK